MRDLPASDGIGAGDVDDWEVRGDRAWQARRIPRPDTSRRIDTNQKHKYQDISNDSGALRHTVPRSSNSGSCFSRALALSLCAGMIGLVDTIAARETVSTGRLAKRPLRRPSARFWHSARASVSRLTPQMAQMTMLASTVEVGVVLMLKILVAKGRNRYDCYVWM